MTTLNPAVTQVAAPPIAAVHEWIAGREFSSAEPLLDVAQAVPVAPPPLALREAVARTLIDDGAHRYTPIAGLPELRSALAAHMSAHYHADIRSGDTVITAGCNQAFCSTVKALAGPGDAVVLPEPYYFNHRMWLEMCGIEVITIPFAAQTNGVPEVQAFADALTPATKAMVVVSPNNPTGAVYSEARLSELYELAASAGVKLILDETYKDFHPDAPAAPHQLFSKDNWRDTVVQLFSFSKSYALTGYRVGSVIAGPDLVREVTKIQDCVSICAPRLSQLMATEALATMQRYVRDEAQAMQARVTALEHAFASVEPAGNQCFELATAGAWFAWVRHPFESASSWAVAEALAREHAVLTVPGEVFGDNAKRYVRFAFANLRAEQMPDLLKRLRQVETAGIPGT